MGEFQYLTDVWILSGPMEVYLASCGSVSCDKFDASNAKWFKINEVGKRNGDGWIQQDQCMLLFGSPIFGFTIANRTFSVDGKAHSFKLPSTLARGGYLLRHEIVALHLADQPGGAEFYPSCIQINVGGSQSGAPSPNELVKFPGGYTDKDPGILVNAFGGAAYKFPGPAISKLASKADVPTGSDGGDTNSDAGSSSSPLPSSTGKTKTPAQPSPSVAPPKYGSGNCNPAKKRAVFDDSDDSIPYVPAPAPETPLDDFKPRHISRVMARMVRPHTH